MAWRYCGRDEERYYCDGLDRAGHGQFHPAGCDFADCRKCAQKDWVDQRGGSEIRVTEMVRRFEWRTIKR